MIACPAASRNPARVCATFLAALLVAACATDAPRGAHEFDDSAGLVEVSVLGDGFVEAAGDRVPLEAIVLTLRQRLRKMPSEDRARFVVRLRPAPISGSAAVKHQVAVDLDRLLQECQIMGVRQVRYL